MPNDPRPARPRRRAPLLRIALILLLAYAGWCALLVFRQSDIIFPRSFAGPGNPAGAPADRPDCQRLWVTAPDGVRIEGWFFRAGPTRPEPGDPPRPCVLCFHGNGELIDDSCAYADFFTGHGLHALLVEYRGYGRSGGMGRAPGEPEATPGERAIIDDSLLFVDLLARRPDVDASRLVYCGRSLGAGVAAQLAARRLPAAVILESPFLSITELARGYLIPPFLVRHPFRTDRVLPPLAAAGLAVLILSSRDDEIIPFSHGRRLAAMMPSAGFVPFTGSHNALPLGQRVVEEAIVLFLQPLVPGAPGRTGGPAAPAPGPP